MSHCGEWVILAALPGSSLQLNSAGGEEVEEEAELTHQGLTSPVCGHRSPWLLPRQQYKTFSLQGLTQGEGTCWCWVDTHLSTLKLTEL